MFQHSPVLQKLVRHLQKVPYLASKNVYRVVMYFLEADEQSIHDLCRAIVEAKKTVRHCTTCFNWTEHETQCSICLSTSRDVSIICVVESWFDLWAIEKGGEFKGHYHVLGGVLCPLEGIGPDALQISPLLHRLNGSTKEIILATNPTPEGEATANYIYTKIRHLPVSVSRLASGVPIGSTLAYMDRVTIAKALFDRRPF